MATNSNRLPEWMIAAGKKMVERADASVVRPKMRGEGGINAEKIRELYRKMTAKDMQTWILARDGRQKEKGNKQPKKEKCFKQMYPMLYLWMQEHDFCLKSSNLTAKAVAMKALAATVMVRVCVFVSAWCACLSCVIMHAHKHNDINFSGT